MSVRDKEMLIANYRGLFQKHGGAPEATQMSAEDKAAAQRAASSFHASPLARTANEPPPISMLVRG